MNTEIYGPLELWREHARRFQPDFEVWIADGPPFRKGTEVPVLTQNYVMAGAGMGDFINWFPAMFWIAENCPWVKGKLHVPGDFGMVEMATQLMEPWPKWKVFPCEKLHENIKPMEFLLGPGVKHNGQFHRQMINGTGGRLDIYGHMVFVNRYPVPDDDLVFPVLRPNLELVPKELRGLRYIVFTPGGACPNRTVPGHYWNPIIDHAIANGLTPVFLGKADMNPAGTKNERGIFGRVTFLEGCHYHKGIDLREKTGLLDAAEIMRNAEVVIGLDNGLLHLAACTDARIVGGFNIVHPEDRKPNRPGLEHRWIGITLTKEELACAHCQADVKRLSSDGVHNFRNCMYKKPNPSKKRKPGEPPDDWVQDTLCIDMLFEKTAYRWTNAIDEMLTRK